LRRIYAEVMQIISRKLLEEDICKDNADPFTGTGGRGSMQRKCASYHRNCLWRISAEVMQILSRELLEEVLCRRNADLITVTA
jgi:hypothetical protein